jgi:uncharacterized protein with von Willebrand factor type A (vWA) domain
MACGPDRVQAFLDATGELGLADRESLYWAGRLTLCSDPDDLPRFDTAFAFWFGGGEMPQAPGLPPKPRQAQVAQLDSGEGADPGAGEEPEPQAVAASAVEVLRRRDLSDLTVSERDHLRRLLSALRLDPPLRPAVRFRPSRRGALDPRATLRGLLRTGGEPLRLPRHGRSTRRRRVVLLIDVSGSMSPYADALLRFAHVVVRRAPATTEVFTLGTRMTRVSRQLRLRDPERALGAASRAVPDFSGGTRLGDTLRLFLDRWGQRGMARGAVVVVFSDGWERGGAEMLSAQMHRLHRLARAVIWANPHAGRDGYEPVQSGITAALPYVDRLVAGHSLRSLQELWSCVLRFSGNPRMGGSAEVGRA